MHLRTSREPKQSLIRTPRIKGKSRRRKTHQACLRCGKERGEREEDHRRFSAAPDLRAVHAAALSAGRRAEAPAEGDNRRALPVQRVPSLGVRLGFNHRDDPRRAGCEDRPRRAR